MTDSEAIKMIAIHYGFEEQSRMLQEECAELIQAVNKVHRKGKTLADFYICAESLIEEMADVKIMIAQIEFLLGHGTVKCATNVNDVMQHKLQRQIKRIKDEKGKDGI